MKTEMNLQTVLALGTALLGTASAAATCNLKPASSPVLANGWESKLVVNGLSKPRGIRFDTSGNLLVIQQGAGLIHLAFNDGGSTCLDLAKKTFLVNSTDVWKSLPHFQKKCL